ncbi:hypothetical protein F0562_014408 [Nyssa sinensis]|uniref:TCP domain-containing protein n=1 Tax=Nyssa sinensis TaxID=561372 RepID=A0A5J4ZRU1_9ASTE|nr:hypothetical protein F0562_014408 [Nyssa sinensis]
MMAAVWYIDDGCSSDEFWNGVFGRRGQEFPAHESAILTMKLGPVVGNISGKCMKISCGGFEDRFGLLRGHILRSTSRKDRHSKVYTAKGPRDQRVWLSAPTAIQFYDVQG